MSLAGVAKETLQIVERGSYVGPGGGVVRIADDVARAVAGTKLYAPDDPPTPALPSDWKGAGARIEVTAETTACATRRLVEDGCNNVACLNFASAKNPGGGFMG